MSFYDGLSREELAVEKEDVYKRQSSNGIESASVTL